MAIYLYLLTSYLLSGLVYLGYRLWHRRQATPLQQRWYLRLGIGLSLVLPLWAIWPTLPEDPYPTHAVGSMADTFVNEPVLDEALMACYDRVETQEGFCHCEQLQQANLLYYHPQPYFNFAIQYQSHLQRIAQLVSLLIVLSLMWKLTHLFKLIYCSPRTVRHYEGRRYICLHHDGPHLAASFRLWHRYVVWHSDLDRLPPAEQDAIWAHEVAHIHSGDTFESIGLSLLQLFWWLNPIYYVLKRDLLLINEHIADQWALLRSQAPQRYAQLLLRLQQHQQRGWIAGMASGDLRKRITAIVRPRPLHHSHWTPWISAAIGIVMLATVKVAAPATQALCFDFERYALMHNQHEAEGKAVFCKSCLYFDLLQARQSAGAQWRRHFPITLQ